MSKNTYLYGDVRYNLYSVKPVSTLPTCLSYRSQKQLLKLVTIRWLNYVQLFPITQHQSIEAAPENNNKMNKPEGVMSFDFFDNIVKLSSLH